MSNRRIAIRETCKARDKADPHNINEETDTEVSLIENRSNIDQSKWQEVEQNLVLLI